MISYSNFDLLNEGIYTELKDEYNSLGEYVEHLYNEVDNKEDFSMVLGQYLKMPKKNYKVFNENDYVLIEYWYNDMLTPVKILEKNKQKYIITHDISESKIRNAPNETIKKEDIIDFYVKPKVDKEIDTNIRIANAVNQMNKYDQMLLVKRLREEFTSDIKENIKYTEGDDLPLLSKSGFNTFRKILNALSLPEINMDRKKCPNDFYQIYVTEYLNKPRLIKIMSRFKSMSPYIDYIEQNENIKLYYGIKYDKSLFVEYGCIIEDNKTVFGEYKLSVSNLKKLSDKLFSDLMSKDDIIKYMKVKKDLTNFSPGYYKKKSNPYIEDNKLIQSYFGVGVWNKGVITEDSLTEIKKEFKEWAKKWKDIKFKVETNDFWLSFIIKL